MLQADLRILVGKHQGKFVPLTEKRFLIGREQDCQLRPNSDLVSRHHCVLSVDDFSVRIRDLGSTNGTRVNDESIRGEVVLKSGDKISVGKLDLELVVGRQSASRVERLSAVTAPNADADTAMSDPAPVAEAEPAAMTQEIPSYNDNEENLPALQPEGVLDSSYDMTAAVDMSGQETLANMMLDTTILPAGATPEAQMQPTMAYPPQAGYAYPPMGYVPQMAGYPPQQGMYAAPYPMQPGMYPPGYGMPAGYGMPPGYGVPQPQAAMPAVVDVPTPAPPTQTGIQAPALKLPKPEETGIRQDQAPAPVAAPAGGAAPPAKPSQKAADIIKQYLNRRANEQ